MNSGTIFSRLANKENMKNIDIANLLEAKESSISAIKRRVKDFSYYQLDTLVRNKLITEKEAMTAYWADKKERDKDSSNKAA